MTEVKIKCEQCKFCKLRIHDPKRIGEKPYNPHYICTLLGEASVSDNPNVGTSFIFKKVNAWDYCAWGEMKEDL